MNNTPLPRSTIWTKYRALRTRSKVLLIATLILVPLLACCITADIIGSHLPASPQSASVATATPVPTATATVTVKQVVIPQKTAAPSPTAKVVPTATPKLVVVPTHAAVKPTATPVPAPTPPLLGANISAFTKKYGTPDSHTDVQGGSYHYQKYGDSNIDFLIVTTDVAGAGVYGQRADTVDVAADNSGWTTAKADAMVQSVLPADAVYKSRVTLSDGSGDYDKVYYSASLAKALPADDFTDASSNPVKPGTFDVLYYVNHDGSISNCNVQVGTQQNQ